MVKRLLGKELTVGSIPTPGSKMAWQAGKNEVSGSIPDKGSIYFLMKGGIYGKRRTQN